MTEWPDGMLREPWPHQHDAYDVLGRLWQERQGVALFSDMGTGKSLVATALFKAYGFHRTLIISGTKAMVDEWPDTIHDETLGSLQAVPLTGTLDERADLLFGVHEHAANDAVFVTNVESYWSGRLAAQIERVPWDCIVFDESQKIKGAGSKAALFAFRLAKLHPGAKRLCMTGTPLHDKPLDAYGQFRFIDPTIFGTNYQAFKDRYATEMRVAQGVYKVIGYKNLDELAEKIRRASFRVEDTVSGLAEPEHHDVKVPLSKATAEMYATLERDGVLEVAGTEDVMIAANALSQMTRLQQLTSGYVTTVSPTYQATEHLVGLEKRDALVRLLESIPADQPVVVFCRFTFDLLNVALAARMTGRSYREQSGRCAQWREWRAKTDGGVLGVQTQAGGAGIDLTRASTAIFYSHTFSLGDYRQAVKRLHRPGQRETVKVYHLVAQVPGGRSIDRAIRNAIKAKREIGTYVVDTYRKAQG